MIVRNIQNEFMSKFWKSYLYQWRVCPGFPGSWRRVLYLMKTKGNNTRFRIMKKFRYLLSKQGYTWMMGDGGGGVFWRFSSSLDWCSGVSWLWDENMISIQIKWSHKGLKFSYLLNRKKEDWLEHLFEVLLLLKIGLEISFSYELSPWCKILWVFSQWPHLSELEHHSRY